MLEPDRTGFTFIRLVQVVEPYQNNVCAIALWACRLDYARETITRSNVLCNAVNRDYKVAIIYAISALANITPADWNAFSELDWWLSLSFLLSL